MRAGDARLASWRPSTAVRWLTPGMVAVLLVAACSESPTATPHPPRPAPSPAPTRALREGGGIDATVEPAVGQWSDLPTGCGLVRARRAGPGRRVRVAAMAPSLTPMRSPFGTDGGGHGAQPRPKVRQRRGRGSGQCNVTLGLGKGHPRMSRWHTCARRCSTVVAVPTCCGGML